jgi:D-amino-acid dehydrogenase
MSSVCVVGAGIIGCATAYQLVRQGFKVHLLDAASQAGSITSFANGAQLSYCYVEPFASPATLRALPGMLLSPGSAVKFRLRADVRQWSWGLRFLLACRKAQSHAGTAKLLEMARLSRQVFNGWMSAEDWSVNFAQNGKLVLCPDIHSLRRQEAQVATQAKLGCRQLILTPAECIMREPALSQRLGRFAGGVWTEDECVVDPYLLCAALVKSLRRLGASITFDSPVSGFVREGGRILAAQTTQGDVRADAFVLAAGSAAPRLAATFGLRLPVYPIKGYSLTLPFRGAARPVASVTDLGRKTVFAPLGDQLRVAAMAEINGYELHIPAARVKAMLASVEHTYPGLCDISSPQPWAGLRPATPDSVPIVGRVGASNMFVNVGHGALGLTLAAGSAAQIAAAMLAQPHGAGQAGRPSRTHHDRHRGSAVSL